MVPFSQMKREYNTILVINIISTSISTQIPNQKAVKKKKKRKKKNEISRQQHSKQANIRQAKL